MKSRLSYLAIPLAAALLATPAYAQRINQMPGHMMPGPMVAPPTAPPAAAGPLGASIVAVVNDNIITSSDLDARIAMALLASGLPDTPEVRARLAPQLLRVLIDEQLQLQEAKKQDITVSQDEIDKATNKIVEDNHIPGGDMKAFLQSRGIPYDALAQQIRAGLSWSKVIQRELRSHVEIGDDEIDAVLERQRANAGKDEFLTSEIFLSVDNPKDEDQVRELAQNLAQQIQQGGVFGAVARQFSQSASAATGGDIGWIQDGELATELNRALESMQVSHVSDPIRAASGYYILGLRDKRTITVGTDSAPPSVELQQVSRPLGSDKTALAKEADQVRTAMTSCGDLKTKVPAQFPAWHWEDLGDVKLASAPAWLTTKVHDVPVGKSTEPMATGGNALIVFVCGKSGGGAASTADREAITNQLGTEKMELQARGLLRDLRRNAYLDVRLGNAGNG
jgi:peptidyl-prolyl cis-trans isomerase SurA